MKNSKVIVVVILVALVAIVGIAIFCNNVRKYELRIPGLSDVSFISLEQQDKGVDIRNEEEIQSMMNTLGGVNKVTKMPSTQDKPVDSEDEILIKLNKDESSFKTLYIYRKAEKYYLEQPYNGIYEITQEQYNELSRVLANN